MSEHLLAELAELENGLIHKDLITRRDQVIATWTASNDDRIDLILKGEKRILDQLIMSIEQARESINKKRRQSAEQKPMSKSF